MFLVPIFSTLTLTFGKIELRLPTKFVRLKVFGCDYAKPKHLTKYCIGSSFQIIVAGFDTVHFQGTRRVQRLQAPRATCHCKFFG